jgi:hypothetical protein
MKRVNKVGRGTELKEIKRELKAKRRETRTSEGRGT